MKKRLLSAVLSLSIITMFVPVYAQNQEESTNAEEYFTDRFIIETQEDNSNPVESAMSVEDVETVINEVLDDMDIDTETAEVTAIEEIGNVVTLSEEVDATEFMQSVEETLGDNIISIQPDYPVYMDLTVNEINETDGSATEEETNVTDYHSWEENLAAAKARVSGKNARVAVLGTYYNAYSSYHDYIDDVRNYVSHYNTNNYATTEDHIISIIHNVAPDAKIIPIGVFGVNSDSNNASNAAYTAYTSDIAKGILHACNKGANVLVCDWYTTEYNQYLERKMNEADILIVASAGYYGSSSYKEIYPACFNATNMLTVSALSTNYNKIYDLDYDDEIDIYSVGKYTYTRNSAEYTINTASTAAAYLAGAAALAIEGNHTSSNLKNILLNSAFTINYRPGESDFESYRALNFYDAVCGNTSNDTIEVTTSRISDSTTNAGCALDMQKIYFANIKQVVSGSNTIAVLLDDGTIKAYMYKEYIAPSSSDYYFGVNCYGEFTTIPDFPQSINHIAVSTEGNALAAIDNNGDVYVVGMKSELGEQTTSSGVILPPEKVSGVTNAESVYFTANTMFVKTVDENNDVKLLSRGDYPLRSGNQYDFAEVSEAENFTDIDFNGSRVAFVKNGKAYLSNSNSSTSGSYFSEVTLDTTSPVTDVELMYNTLYILTENKVLYALDTSSSSSSLNYANYIDTNVTKIAASENMLLYSTCSEYLCLPGNSAYSVYSTPISQDLDINSFAEFGSTTSPTYYSNVEFGTYVLTSDQTLYRGPLCNSNASYSNDYDTSFYTVAQKNFTAQAIDSVVPVNIEEQYGSEYLDLGIDEILAVETRGKATITLADGTDVVVPVAWTTTDFDKTQLGTQTLNGTMTLPQGITKPDSVDAKAYISIKAPITNVENTQITVNYDTTKAEIIAQLPSTVNVTVPAGATSTSLPVTWDTSTFEPQPSSTYTLYGHIQTNDEICNPYDKVSVATVTVGPNPPKVIDDIRASGNINVPYNTSLNSISLPETAIAELDDGTTVELNVDWDTSQYNPQLEETPQTLIGTVIFADSIANPYNRTASVNIIVAPEAEGNIQSIDTVYINAYQSVPFEQIPDVPSYVTITAENGSSALLPVTWNMESYNPDSDFLTGNQVVSGTVTLTEKLTNTGNIPAVLVIHLTAASYTAESIAPDEDNISVDYGTSLEQIKAAYNNTVTVSAANIATEDEIELVKALVFDDEENATYDATTPGTYDLIARPVLTSNITASDELYYTLHVTVNNKRTINNVLVSNASTYQYTPFDDIELPQTASVSLNDGTTKEIAVEWDEEMYNPTTVGTQIILGSFVDYPISVEESSLYQPVLSLTVKNVNYVVSDIIYGDVETVYAGLTLDELEDCLFTNSVGIEITAELEDNVSVMNTIDVPFTINQDEVVQEDIAGDELYYYISDEVGTYILPTKLTLPENVSFGEDYDIDIESDYDLIVDTEPVDVTEATKTEYDKTVIRGTAFNNLGLEQEVPVVLENGKTVNVPITWDDEYYDADAEESILDGTVDWPDYINGYIDGTPVEFFYTITTVEAETFTLVSVTPNQLPTSGIFEVNLGTTLDEIKQLLGVDEVTVTLADSTGETHTETVGFELRTQDNPTFSTTTAGYYELVAHLNLGDNVSNPDNVQLIVKVETTVKTVKAISSVRVTGVTKGTAFADINMPSTVSVTFTDNTTEQVPVTWNGSNYNPNKTGSQRVTGTLNLPTYITNPNNRTATAVITVVAGSTTQLISLTPQQSESPILRMNTMSLFHAPQTVLSDDLIEHKYIAEYLNEDGTITTEEISFYDIIE